jgi:hypothetical protein
MFVKNTTAPLSPATVRSLKSLNLTPTLPHSRTLAAVWCARGRCGNGLANCCKPLQRLASCSLIKIRSARTAAPRREIARWNGLAIAEGLREPKWLDGRHLLARFSIDPGAFYGPAL